MNEKLETLINKRVDVSLPVAIGVSLLTFGGGLAVGYIIRHLQDRPRPLTDEERAELDDIQAEVEAIKAQARKNDEDIPHVDLSPLSFPGIRLPDDKVIIDEKAWKREVDEDETGRVIVLHDPDDMEPVEPVTTNGTVRRNVFAEQTDPEDDWDYDAEIASRTKSNPYVIHRDEFFEESEEYEGFQDRQLTWYNGDGVLVDEATNPVYNHTEVVGEMKFGHGSGDPNVVYIRNERLKAQYEIWLHAGRYDVEVQGADMEDVTAAETLRHAHAPRKFRPE